MRGQREWYPGCSRSPLARRLTNRIENHVPSTRRLGSAPCKRVRTCGRGRQGFEAVCPGTDCQQIEGAACAVITEAGGECFIHRTGEGVGLTTHEPFIVEGETQAVVVPGMCFSIEPVQAAS
jgi:Metallopeptidase family M24